MHPTIAQPLRLATSLAILSSGLGAQPPLELDVVGGSMPGILSLDLHPGLYPFQACFILVGITPGPTPIAWFDPTDPRYVNVGLEIISLSFFGLVGLDLHFRVGPSLVPASPNLLNNPFFFQGITLGGATTLVERISLPRVIRMANAGTFHDRLGAFMDQRAFATTLPRNDGSWMVVGGGRGGLLSQVAHRTTEIYDPLTEAFSYGPPLNTERSLHTQTLLADGRWLLTGGVDRQNDPQASCEIYDVATHSFTPVAPMIHPRMGHTATLLPSGKVLVTGGLVAMTVTPTPLNAIYDTTNTTEIYDPVANTWTAGPNLRTPRAGHAALVRADNRVALCGGISWDVIIIQVPAVRSSVDIYDPVANTITAGPSMASPRAMVEPVPLGNHRYLLAGGINSLTLINLGTPTAAAEIYNGATNSWSSAGSMATARGIHKGWALDGNRFLIAGGANGTILSPNSLASSEIYDATANTWSAGPSLNIPRSGPAVFRTPTGQMQVFGGGSSQGAISSRVEFYYF
jgi:hypothetical protein